MEETALVIGATIPQHQGETDGGTPVPLVYLFTYETDAIQSPGDYCFCSWKAADL